MNNWSWLPCDRFEPTRPGTYLVTTANGYIRIDRWDGEEWGLCRVRHEVRHRNKGRYRLHRAFAEMPKAYGES